MLYNGLPVFKLYVGNETDGLRFLSIVDDPAIESNFVMLSKEEPEKIETEFSSDDERHDLYGPVLRPNFPIYRKANGGFYVVFDRETIEQLEKKFFAESVNFNIDLNHDHNPIKAYVFESFIKDTAKGINPAGWEDLEEGTWFVRMHIESDSDWELIKKYMKGFSVMVFTHFVELCTEPDPQDHAENARNLLDELLDMNDQC